MRWVRPPRAEIHFRTGGGYIEYSMWVASALVTARPLAPKSQAAWKPRLACEVTQIRSWGTAPSTMAQALVFVDIGADPAAAIIGNPHHRLARPYPRQQQYRRKQPRQQLHIPAPV